MVEQGKQDTRGNPELELSGSIKKEEPIGIQKFPHGENPEMETSVIIKKEEIAEDDTSPRAVLENSGLSSDSDDSSDSIGITPTGDTPETKISTIKEEETIEQGTSPKTVLEGPMISSDSDNSSNSISTTASSFTSSSTEKVPTKEMAKRALVKESHGLHWKHVLDVLKRKSGRKVCTIPLKGSRDNLRKKKLTRIRSAEDGIDYGGLTAPKKPSWRNFDYSELAAATNDFCPENLIGKGGHAEVYKGCLPDGQLVAVKRLIKKDKEEEIRIADFLSELGIIAHIDHPNAARLLGFSIDGGLHLVLQFSPHGSLASVLHGSTEGLEWKIRFKVAVGVAEGLQYLHHGCRRRIIHRDIKASNILLTEDYEPQISDFGLAKWLPEKWAHHVVFPIEGTFGYLAPEYFMHGIIDEKTDVFAYGVLLLELITGRHAVDSCRQSLVMWAKPFLDSNNIKELADPRLNDAYDVVEMKRAILAASMCINHLSKMRPDMRRVVQTLKGDVGLLEWKQKSVSGRALLLDACDLEDYTCTKYLNDLDRHMQLAME